MGQSPEVVAVDDRQQEDVLARRRINAGETPCTIHGRDYDSILRRPSLKELLAGAFARYIVSVQPALVLLRDSGC